MGTILLQAVPDETITAIKTYAADAGVSPGEIVARLTDFYAELRRSDDPAVLKARHYANLP
jgi:hypothetical protein